MAVTTALIDGYDLLSIGKIVEPTEFPPAKTEDGDEDVSADDYLAAPFTLTLLLDGSSAANARALVTDLTNRMKAGAVLTLALDSMPSLESVIESVQPGQERYDGSTAIVTFSGLRRPFWLGPSKTLTPLSVDCFGTADVVESIDGEVEAEVTLRATSPQATEFIALGIQHDPQAAYDPIDDYSGASDANCVGGAKSADLTVTGTPTVIATAPSLNASDNRGEHLLCARVTASSAATELAASSAATASVGAAVSVDEPSVTVPAAALRGVVLGSVKVPVADMPNLQTSGSAWVATTGISQTGGTAKAFPTYERIFQTFTLAARRKVTKVRAKVTNSGAQTVVYAGLFAAMSNLPGQIISWSPNVTVPGSATTVIEFTFSDVLAAGDYAIGFEGAQLSWWRNTDAASYSGGQGGYDTTAGDGTDTSIDLYFEIDLEEEVSLGATTSVKASGSGTAALDVVARIPKDDFCIVVDRTASADEGFQYEDGVVYVANAAGQVGASLMGSGANVYGRRKGFAPGVTNRIVVAADTPYNAAPSDIAVSGSYRERWIHLARSS